MKTLEHNELTLNNIEETGRAGEVTVKNPKGAGRPKGSTAKITAAILLAEAARQSGETFEEALVKDWLASACNSELRFKYNNLILNKVVADQHHVEVDETSTVENRQLAFLKALETIGTVAIKHETATVEHSKIGYDNDE